MGRLCELLMEDCRLREGLNTCINCGTCSAICPAAEFYRYDPRRIVDTVQRGDEEEIESLLKSDTIWYCGQCMSCTTRCPRKNGAGLVVMALRNLSATNTPIPKRIVPNTRHPLLKEKMRIAKYTKITTGTIRLRILALVSFF